MVPSSASWQAPSSNICILKVTHQVHNPHFQDFTRGACGEPNNMLASPEFLRLFSLINLQCSSWAKAEGSSLAVTPRFCWVFRQDRRIRTWDRIFFGAQKLYRWQDFTVLGWTENRNWVQPFFMKRWLFTARTSFYLCLLLLWAWLRSF